MRLPVQAQPEGLRSVRYPRRSVSDCGASKSLDCGPLQYPVRLLVDTYEMEAGQHPQLPSTRQVPRHRRRARSLRRPSSAGYLPFAPCVGQGAVPESALSWATSSSGPPSTRWRTNPRNASAWPRGTNRRGGSPAIDTLRLGWAWAPRGTTRAHPPGGQRVEELIRTLDASLRRPATER